MSMSDTRRSPIEMLAEDFSRRLHAGEHPTIEEYLQNYPSYADGIRKLFPIVAILEEAKPGAPRMASATVQEPALPAQTQFGDFVIQREVGRGGMGVVYEASQRSLNRRVALKVLPANYLPSAKHVMRFKREAHSAARLHHTNIAPVFGVGDQNGSHFYAMQYIEGYSLDAIVLCLKQLTVELEEDLISPEQSALEFNPHNVPSSTGIAQLLVSSKLTTEQPRLYPLDSDEVLPHEGIRNPSLNDTSDGGSPMRFWRFFMRTTGVRTESYYWRNLAGIGIQVASALKHAHDQTVYHRDIKPSNLMIDFTGKIWVTDFGLARVMGDPNLTASNDTVGTLRYMAPEQFQGEFDVRTEIYNLGVTLYEIATLQPAVTEPEVPQLIMQSINHPPIRPRAINPEIPRDLETIILKSIATDPSDRYQTALELSEDLKRFASGDVIHAGRKRPLATMWRWCQHNKAIARLASAVLILLLTVAVVATVGFVHTKRALNSAAEDRDNSQKFREKAEKNERNQKERIDMLEAKLKQLQQELKQ